MQAGEKKQNKIKKHRFVKIFAIIIGVTIAIGSIVGFTFLNEQQHMKNVVNVDTIYDNIFINDIDVGGLTKEEALIKMKENYKPADSDQKIVIKHENESIEIKYADLNPNYDFTAAVDEAYLYAREGSLDYRYSQITALETSPMKITYTPVVTYDESLVASKIAPVTDKFNVAPVSATMSMVNGKFVITPEKVGYQVDLEATEKAVLDLISENKVGTVELVMEEVPPQVVTADLENSKSLIGSYTTTFSGSPQEARNVNIINACSKINGVVVNPGETFSTNIAFGEMTYDNGYANATVIQGGEFVDGMGGGVCQVSSTLYNALLYAELPIVERQNHSLKVGYVDWGFDATLAGDYIDLKFLNDTGYPVIIESYIDGNKVVVNLYGHEVHAKGRTLSFSNALVSSSPPGAEEIIADPNLPEGERVVEKNGKNSYTYDVYKTVYQDGQEVETVHVNTSYYKPAKPVVRVGTGANVVVAPDEAENAIKEPNLSEDVDTTAVSNINEALEEAPNASAGGNMSGNSELNDGDGTETSTTQGTQQEVSTITDEEQVDVAPVEEDTALITDYQTVLPQDNASSIEKPEN